MRTRVTTATEQSLIYEYLEEMCKVLCITHTLSRFINSIFLLRIHSISISWVRVYAVITYSEPVGYYRLLSVPKYIQWLNALKLSMYACHTKWHMHTTYLMNEHFVVNKKKHFCQCFCFPALDCSFFQLIEYESSTHFNEKKNSGSF